MGSVVLDADADSISRSSGPAYNAATVAFWVKLDSALGGFSSCNLTFLRASGYSYGVYGRLYISDPPSNGCDLMVGASAVGTTTSSTDPDVLKDQWLYFAITSAGAVTDGGKAYVWSSNGTLQQSVSITPAGSGTIDLLTMGLTDGNSTRCKIAYGRVWSRVLTQANLEAEMFSPSVVGTTDIYSAWTDDPTTDVSGQSHPFTTSGTTLDTGDTPPVLRGGRMLLLGAG